jgi:pilus assembly protein FimV
MLNKKLTANMHTKSSPNPRRVTQTPSASWRTTAITAALGVLLSTAYMNAQALALGPITSLSSLGEPLVAGIAVPQISPEEFASLKVTLGTPQDFKTAGMEYNAALSSAQLTLQRRPDGSTYLLLRSNKVVTDPFVNVVVTAAWTNGEIVRNYTLLLDPPAMQQNEARTITAPLMALAPTPVPAPAASIPAPKSEPVSSTIASPAPAPVAQPVAQARPSPCTSSNSD